LTNEIKLYRKTEVQLIALGLIIAFIVAISFTTYLTHTELVKNELVKTDQGIYPYYEFNWFVYVGIGVAAFFILLLHTTVLEKPRDYAKLPIFEFFALTILMVSLVLAVVFYPTEILPNDAIIKKSIISYNVTETINNQPIPQNVTQWAITVGTMDDKRKSGFQIPIYIIVAGTVGAYIRYLYSNVKEIKKERPELLELKRLYLLQKKIVNTLCIAGGLNYEKIRKSEDIPVVRLKHMLKFYDENRPKIYFLPPSHY